MYLNLYKIIEQKGLGWENVWKVKYFLSPLNWHILPENIWSQTHSPSMQSPALEHSWSSLYPGHSRRQSGETIFIFIIQWNVKIQYSLLKLITYYSIKMSKYNIRCLNWSRLIELPVTLTFIEKKPGKLGYWCKLGQRDPNKRRLLYQMISFIFKKLPWSLFGL